MIKIWFKKAMGESDKTMQHVILRYKQNNKPVQYAMDVSTFAKLEMMGGYQELELRGRYAKVIIDNVEFVFCYNFPEQYISDLLDFAYGVAENNQSDKKEK